MLPDDDEPNAAADQATATATEERPATPSDVDLGDIPGMIERVAPTVVTVLAERVQGEGSGSGVIWDEHGRIVTNNHVVDGAGEIEVALASGARLGARVVGADARTDLAVLDIDREGVPTARFAEGLPRVGELAIARWFRQSARGRPRRARDCARAT